MYSPLLARIFQRQPIAITSSPAQKEGAFFSQSQLAEKGDVSSSAGASVPYEIPVSLLHDECSSYPPPPLIILAPQPIFTKHIKYVSRELVHYSIILRPFRITLNLIIKHNQILLDMESHTILQQFPSWI